MDRGNFQIRQLLELDACANCRACADICPAVQASGQGELSGVVRLKWLRDMFKGRGGIFARLWKGRRPSPEQWERFAGTVYQCTLCGNCQEVCPAGIRLRELWLSLRQELVQQGLHPEKVDTLRENLAASYNVFNEDQEDRLEWVEDLAEPPEHGYLKESAATVYFTGCVAAFFPLGQLVPSSLSQVLDAGKVDWTLLGEEEWCCGFPLLGAGALGEAKEIIAHNLEAVRAKGAREVVFACPSCYMMWLEHYPTAGLKLYHASQYLQRLLERGRLPLKRLEMKVTYHDPCDLGRGARLFEPPRRVIQAIPGVELVEMAANREACRCCGGGGNLEMIDAELNKEIAAAKIAEVVETGAEAVITSCQQCIRTMATYARRNKLDLKVMDISQLLHQALDLPEDD